MKPYILIFILQLIFGSAVFAAPPTQLLKMMETPASLMDVFLLRLYRDNSCHHLELPQKSKNVESLQETPLLTKLQRPKYCLKKTPEYIFDLDIFFLSVSIYRDERLETIISKTTQEAERERVIIDLMSSVSSWVGANGCKRDNKSGVIFSSNAGGTGRIRDIEYGKMRCEFSERIKIMAVLFNPSEMVAYNVFVSPFGKIESIHPH